MCTVVVLRRPGHPWPLLLAANRDEMTDRPWQPPARHWPDRPAIVAGKDDLAGGAWLGLNDDGVVAGVLNRINSLGPRRGKRSRGELVLEALSHASASAAATRASLLDPTAFRSFNLVVADRKDAYWLRSNGGEGKGNSGGGGDGTGPARIEIFELQPGFSMITAHDRNDPTSARVRYNLPIFEAADPPDPKTGKWRSWQRIMSSQRHPPMDGPDAAMTVVTDRGFETVSSSLIGLPGMPQSLRGRPASPVWLFAAGRPDTVPYKPVDL
jgi:Transport and Golgi organisation 2